MPAPGTAAPDWASDVNHSAPGETWDGLATKVAPSSGQIAAGFQPEQEPPGEWLNYLFNNYGDWIRYLSGFFDGSSDEFEYPTVRVRTIHLVPSDASNYGSSDWGFIAGGRDAILSAANGANLIYSLAGIVPSGAEITDVDVMVRPGAARASASRVEVELIRSTPDWGTPGIPTQSSPTGGYGEDDGTTSDQVIALTVSGIGDAEDHESRALFLRVRSGVDGGAHNPDRVYAIRIVFRDPGPRNF